MVDEKLGLHLNDGGYTIIVNTKCPKEKIPQGLEGFFAYLDTGKVDERDQLVCRINESVERANYDTEVESVMSLEEEMKIQSEYAREEGFERGIEQGIERGRSEGEQLGLERGRDEGAAHEKREIAKNMKAKQIDSKTIFEITGLSLNEIEAL